MRSICWTVFAGMAVLSGLSAEQRKVTFSEDVRPILKAKCIQFHRPGGMGPFALSTYAEARRHSVLLRQVALTAQMPPIDAKSEVGKLSDITPLTPDELRKIQEWIREGMPEGNKQPAIPNPAPTFPRGYKEVRAGKGFEIPVEGQLTRAVFPVPRPAGLDSITGFAFVPEAPKAVRQVTLAIQRQGDEPPFQGSAILPGSTVIAWSDGHNTFRASGAEIRLGAEDKLWAQVLAIPVGKVEPASGAFRFHSNRAANELKSRSLGTKDFLVQAEKQQVLQAVWTLDRDIDLYAVLPEARFTTDSVRLSANGKTILLVHTWNPVWPGAYNFSQPIKLTKGTTLVYESTVVNTKHGHAAEDQQTQPVKFGPGDTDEVFWCHLLFAER